MAVFGGKEAPICHVTANRLR